MSQRASLLVTSTSGAWLPLSTEALWDVSPLWASMPLCAVGVALADTEALGVGAEVVAPEVG